MRKNLIFMSFTFNIFILSLRVWKPTVQRVNEVISAVKESWQMQEENIASHCLSDICTELVGLSSQKLIHMMIIAQTTGHWLILTWKDQGQRQDTPARICISKVPNYIKFEQGFFLTSSSARHFNK